MIFNQDSDIQSRVNLRTNFINGISFPFPSRITQSCSLVIFRIVTLLCESLTLLPLSMEWTHYEKLHYQLGGQKCLHILVRSYVDYHICCQTIQGDPSSKKESQSLFCSPLRLFHNLLTISHHPFTSDRLSLNRIFINGTEGTKEHEKAYAKIDSPKIEDDGSSS